MSDNPADRKYSKTQEWFKAEGDVVTIGITQYAADALTDITFVELPAIGTTIDAGSAFGEIESVKATSELCSAVGGEVIETNATLTDQPEKVNDDPFDQGWMIKVRISDPSPLEQLMDAPAYEKMMAEGQA